MKLGKDPESAPEFRRVLARLEQFSKLYAARSAALDKIESETLQPVRVWKRSLRTNGRPATIVTPECSRFLDRMEEYYSGI